LTDERARPAAKTPRLRVEVPEPRAVELPRSSHLRYHEPCLTPTGASASVVTRAGVRAGAQLPPSHHHRSENYTGRRVAGQHSSPGESRPTLLIGLVTVVAISQACSPRRARSLAASPHRTQHQRDGVNGVDRRFVFRPCGGRW
jgi:hypothetical protein